MRLSKLFAAACGCCLGLGLAAAAPAATYNLGGTDNASDPGNPWAFQGFDLTHLRTALANPANFGPGGIVHTTIVASGVDNVTAANLSGLNGFVGSYWYNSNASPTAVSALQSFFLSGHDLFLLDDDHGHDPVANALGIPTAIPSSSGAPSNGTGPLITGPFGTATNITEAGTVGFLNTSDILAHGGHIGALNAQGQVTAAYWNAGDYAAGAGRLVITADVDMIDDAYGNVSYTPLNGNGTFALNAAAFLVSGAASTGGSSTPLPAGAWGGMILLAGIVFAAKRGTTLARA